LFTIPTLPPDIVAEEDGGMGVRRPLLAGVAALATASGCSSTVTAGPRPAHPVELRPAVQAAAVTSTSTSTVPPPGLVWSPNRVPSRVRRAATRLSPADVVSVANGTVWLPAGHQAPAGFSVPVDVSAAWPRRYAAAVHWAPKVLRTLTSGHVILSADSARLRGLQVGNRMRLGGHVFRVAGIVSDWVIGNAEAFVTGRDGVRLHLPPYRYLLVRPADLSDWPGFARRLRRAVPASTPVRIRRPGAARALRQADSVLSPLEQKLDFGEFSVHRPIPSSGWFTVNPGWRNRRLVSTSVPILGTVTCNRALIPRLRAALREVVDDGLAWTVHRNDYGGCYAPRLVDNRVGQAFSHHAYGSALDINVHSNPLGARPHQDARLVRIFARHGLTWGGLWLVPDGMHFEGRW
jgi:hypothetical protein